MPCGSVIGTEYITVTVLPMYFASFPLYSTKSLFFTFQSFHSSSPLILQSVSNEIKVPASNQPITLAFITCSLHFQSHISAPISQAIPYSWRKPTISLHTPMPLSSLKSYFLSCCLMIMIRCTETACHGWSSWSQFPCDFSFFCMFLLALAFGWWPLWGQGGLCTLCNGDAKLATIISEELGRMKNIHTHPLNSA